MSSLLLLVVLAGLALAALTVSLSHKEESYSAAMRSRAFYLAEAGINETLFQLAASEVASKAKPQYIGSEAAPVQLKNGSFWCDIVDNGDSTFTVTSTGSSNFKRKTVQAVVSPLGASVWDHAIFAGNADGDPGYTLKLGGVGGQADDITGNVYSGGSVELQGDANVAGTIDAVGTISGGSGNEGAPHPIPNIAGMNYDTNHDYNVADMFTAGASLRSSAALGGTAWQLPESSPAHVFRKNPSDRTTETSGTPQDDFFLEDPYMPAKDFTVSSTGKRGHTITLSGDGEPGPSGTDKVYFIEGNLWVHNKPFGRLRIKSDSPDGTKITFVVKGNIYFSDDVYMNDPDTDGIAFIAIEDSAYPDTGNIYLGDPRFGTLDEMETFLFAENNFYDNNLSATGSKKVKIKGNMTAGNQVAIDRDYVNSDGSVEHSQLSVEFDDRISRGTLILPGIPGAGLGFQGYQVVFWRELGEQ